MKKINFNQPIKNLDGNAMKKDKDNELMIKELVANSLCVAKSKKTDNAVRQLNLALEIYNSKEAINVEEADIKIINDILKEAEFSTLVLGQILKVIDEAETVK